MQAQQILTRVWKWLSEDKRLGQLILVILIPYLLMLVLPQAPVTVNDTAAFSRWLAELRPVLGASTKSLAALGLLATGEEKCIAAVKEYIYKKGIANPKMKLSVETARGSACGPGLIRRSFLASTI